jgi:IS30 family transposase
MEDLRKKMAQMEVEVASLGNRQTQLHKIKTEREAKLRELQVVLGKKKSDAACMKDRLHEVVVDTEQIYGWIEQASSDLENMRAHLAALTEKGEKKEVEYEQEKQRKEEISTKMEQTYRQRLHSFDAIANEVDDSVLLKIFGTGKNVS